MAHPLYRLIGQLSQVRRNSPALRRGSTVVRTTSDEPGLLAFSRILDGREVLVAINTSTKPADGNVQVEVGSDHFLGAGRFVPGPRHRPGQRSDHPSAARLCDLRCS